MSNLVFDVAKGMIEAADFMNRPTTEEQILEELKDLNSREAAPCASNTSAPSSGGGGGYRYYDDNEVAYYTARLEPPKATGFWAWLFG